MPVIYVIAGCNGAGKTTASYTLLPEMLGIFEFVNADEIAKGLSPFNPESVAFQSGRIMLGRIRDLIEEQKDFAFETTLSTKSYLPLLKQAKENGYQVNLVFFYLKTPELAIFRVEKRVKSGGHNIPKEVILRRYERGLQNLFQRFMAVSDYWMIVDNSDKKPNFIAEGTEQKVLSIADSLVFNQLKKYENSSTGNS